MSVLDEIQDRGILFMNKINRSGPRIDPWDTPERTVDHSDV